MTIEDVAIKVDNVEARLDRLEVRFDELDQRVDALALYCHQEFAAVRQEMRDGFAAMRQDMFRMENRILDAIKDLAIEVRSHDARLLKLERIVKP